MVDEVHIEVTEVYELILNHEVLDMVLLPNL